MDKSGGNVNPILNESIVGGSGFYVASVMEVNGSIWMYAEAPIVADDYGPLSLFTAPSPEGPYTNRGTVLVGGEPGSWDHTEFSESKVAFRAGVFHLFYSAGSTPPAGTALGIHHHHHHQQQRRQQQRRRGRRLEGSTVSSHSQRGRRRLGDAWETTGYAFSFDGVHFVRNVNNPVMAREADPNV
jgi:hypothetical protein